MNLKEFIVEAKKNTYASGSGKISSSRNKSHDLEYLKDNFRYHDSYFGGRHFSGEEIVYDNDVPVWSMNYYGTLIKEDLPEGFIETLKEALVNVDESAPYRGPKKYTRGNYRFECTHVGDFDFFRGIESIFLNDVEVYRLYFHGGKVLE